MNMDYDYEHEDADGREIVFHLDVEYTATPFLPAVRFAPPERCCPAEGGEIVDVSCYVSSVTIDGREVGPGDPEWGQPGFWQGRFDSLNWRQRIEEKCAEHLARQDY